MDQASLLPEKPCRAAEQSVVAVESLKSGDLTHSTSMSLPAELVSHESGTGAGNENHFDPVAEFESAWQSGVPDIRDFLPDDMNATTNSERESILIALIECDLRARWTPGLSAQQTMESWLEQSVPDRFRLRDYVRIFPELRAITALPPQLIAAEFRIMLAAGELPQLNEYLTNELVHDGLVVDAVLPVLNRHTPQRSVLCNGFLGMLGRLLQFFLVTGFIARQFGRVFAVPGQPLPFVAIFVATGASMLIVAMAVLGKFHPREVRRVIGWRRPGFLHAVITMALPVPWFLVANSVTAISWGQIVRPFLAIDFSFYERAYLAIAQEPWPVMIAVGCLLPALAEEIFFRAFIGRGLINAYGVVAGVLLTSLIFGLMHGRIGHVVFAFLFGIVLHFVFLMTKSIFAPMMLHALNNLLAFTQLRLMQSGTFNATQGDSTYIPTGLLLTSILTFVLLLILLRKTQSRWMIAKIRLWTPGFVSGESPPKLIPAEPVAGADFRTLKRFSIAAYVFLLVTIGMTVSSWQGLSLANLADQRLDEGQIDEAEETSRRAILMAPKLACTHAVRAWVLVRASRNQEARQSAELAVSIDPSFSFSHTVLGWLSYLEGSHKDAVEECSLALELNDEDDFAYATRGAARFLLDELDEAIDDSSRAIQINPELTLAFSMRGAAWTERGQLEKANLDLSKSIELDPSDDFSRSWRARVRFEKSEYAGAIEDAGKAIEIDPDNRIANYYLGYALMETHETAEAIVHLSRYLALTDNHDSALKTRAKLLLQIEDASAAIDDLSDLITRFPEDAELFSLRSQAHQLLGDSESANLDEVRFDRISYAR